MNNNILSLEQMQKMSIDEIIDAYRSGSTLLEASELPTYSTSITPIAVPIVAPNANIHQTHNMANALQTDSHYTAYDIGVIAAAIGISVGLLTLIIRYMIRKEEDRIIREIKQVTQKAGIVEKLIPIAERIGERILAPKTQTQT